MPDLMEKIWIVDESRLGETFISAYKNGQVAIHDGVAYWAAGSGKVGIIEHLPLKEAFFDTTEQALQVAQTTIVLTAVASTTLILGAIIAQTKYLSRKIEKLQETADLLSKDIHTNNILFYIDQATSYCGELETARLLVSDRSISEEIKEIASSSISNLISKRNKILLVIENILNIAEAEQLSNRHLELVLNFAHAALDIIPKGIHIEYILSSRTTSPKLAELIIIDGEKKYTNALTSYKNHLNRMHKSILQGTIGEKLEIFKRIESDAKNLINSKNNKLLLSLQTRTSTLAQNINITP